MAYKMDYETSKMIESWFGPMMFVAFLLFLGTTFYFVHQNELRQPQYDYTIELYDQSGGLYSSCIQRGRVSFTGSYLNGMTWFKVSGKRKVEAPVGWRISVTKMRVKLDNKEK